MQDMRDFRDAKAMAHTLRAALAAKGFKITVSQSLELIAEAFGAADWNTLAAAIRREALTPGKNASSRSRPTAEWAPTRSLELALHRAIAHAGQRGHEYTTLEHLLLALTDEEDASAVMKACKVDPGALRKALAGYIDNELTALVADFDGESRPTPAFQRVAQRAMLKAQGLGRDAVTGGDLLVAMFDETESPAVWLLGEQGMTQPDAANLILHWIVKKR
jgi:Glyoxalase superfamily protein/Clp amino terminal domain, pathogenicity island component